MAILAIFLIILFVLLIGAIFLFSFFNIVSIFLMGAYFAPTLKKEIERMVSLSGVKPGDKAVDLGSGDGRLVIALAKAGAEAHGYEINPLLVLIAKINIKMAGLSGKAFSHWKNFWELDLSEFNVVTVFGITYMMKKLETKLKKELKPGSKIVSNYFIFPDWQHSKKESNAYLYEKK